MARTDSIWLTLRAGLRDLILQEHHRPSTLFNEFRDPDYQTPQIVTLIGQQTKTMTMRKLRFGSLAPDGINGEIHLLADENSSSSDSPVVFADCELHNSAPLIQTGAGERLPGNITRRPLEWHRKISQPLDRATLAHILYSKLVAPFSNIICLFAEDFGGLSAVMEVLTIWLVGFSNRPSELPLATMPHIMVFTRLEDYASCDEFDLTKRFMESLKKEIKRKRGSLFSPDRGKLKAGEIDQLVAAQLGCIFVLPLPPHNASSRSWKSLRARILKSSHELQQIRKASQVAFSARHLGAFFHLACGHFCADIVSPFSFIRASRAYNPVPAELLTHAVTFLKLVNPVQVLNFAVPVIASALVFDSYPAGMHGFNPTLVFRHFFQQLCLQLDPFTNCQQEITSAHLVNAIEVFFCELASQILNSKTDEVALHRTTLKRFKVVWKEMYSNNECLACLARTPENTLRCRHALCWPCTMAHGSYTREEPWTFWVSECPLCEEPHNGKFTSKPCTAGVRAIISEGGGIRGIVPLRYLIQLEKELDLPMSVQEHFDIAFGCSSGALIILGLFFNKWTAETCRQQFCLLSKSAFRRRALFRLPFVSGITSQIFEVVMSFITDSRYSSKGITKALQTAFDSNTSLFETNITGTKIGLVATTTTDSSTCLFTNYNGPKSRSRDCGYSIIRPRDIGEELKVWQAARASSAAPPYFKPYQGYQDGALGGHNNPINLALWEQDTIWARKNKQPDIVLSLGTGFKRTSDLEESALKTSFLRARCLPRLFRSFLNFFVGETRWQELQNNLKPQTRDRYHRLNIEFYGDEPELDDLQAMPSLEQQAKQHALSSNDIHNCADNMLASLFYLELITMPKFHRTLFTCQAVIKCRLAPSHPALRTLAFRLRESQAHFYMDFEQKLPCLNDATFSSIEAGVPFACPVVFKVMSLEDYIDVKIDGLTKRARSISNCPYQVQTIIRDQGLDSVFGSRWLRKRSQPEMEEARSKRVKFCSS